MNDSFALDAEEVRFGTPALCEHGVYRLNADLRQRQELAAICDGRVDRLGFPFAHGVTG